MRNDPRNPLEADEQQAVVKWLRLRRVRFTHVPNQGMFPVQYRAKLSRMGLQSGIPDILIFSPPPHFAIYVGVGLEMKRIHGGRVSAEQQAWMAELERLNWRCFTAHGAMDAIRQLEYLGY